MVLAYKVYKFGYLDDWPQQEDGGHCGRRPPLEVDRDEDGDEADDGGVARGERLPGGDNSIKYNQA